MSGVSAVMVAGQVFVTDEPTLVCGAKAVRKSLVVANTGDGAIWLGGPAVTPSNGFRLSDNTTYVFDDYSGDVYAVAGDLETQDVRFMEVGG